MSSKEMTIQAEFHLFGQIKKRGEWFIANCPPLDLTTQGHTLQEARKNLIEAAELFIISCLERGTLDQALRELGFVKFGREKRVPIPPGAFRFPVPIPLYLQRHAECPA
jgi:predicted RNase H-like HicB family nuclease